MINQQTPPIDPHLVQRLCGVTADREVVHDQLDDSVWVRMATPARAATALNVINAHGIAGHDLEDGRLHVTGWDRRLLHWRLGALLAGVDDLQSEWIGTAELACYHYDRRLSVGVEPDWADVLADVEGVIRSCLPLPHQAPRSEDIGVLLELIAAAADAYERLVAEHVEYAEQVLAAYVDCRHYGAA